MFDRWNAIVDIDPDVPDGSGPLGDLSIGIKSNIAVENLPWTAGMGTRRDIVAGRDAEVVARLRTAGAYIPCTLNMHEAALGATTDNAFYGRTTNPHRRTHTPGGSSGGSAAAVAAGLVDVALGTDTLGSIRIPAAYCGVYGLKPTLGAVSTDGLVHLGSAFDVIGPLARDLDVLERVWRVIGTRPQMEGRLTDLVVLDTLGGVAIEPDVEAAYTGLVERFGRTKRRISLAATLTSIRLAGLVPCVEELKSALGDARHGPLVSDELKAVIAGVEAIPPAPELLERTRTTLIDAIGANGFLVMPTTPHAAFAHGTRAPASQADFTCLASVVGLPAIAVPAGTDRSGLPVGIQIVGPADSETQLIELARLLESQLGGYIPPQLED